MLNALRRGSKGILAKLLIALLVFAFAIWGISDFVNQVDPTEVARAGDTPVSATEFSRVYSRVASRTSQQMGQGLTPQQAQAIGLPTQVLSTLITDALQVDAAHALGLDLGDEVLAQRIRQIEAFTGPDGTFSPSIFNRVLAENRYSEAEFIELERDGAAQEMLVNALVGGMGAPEPYLEAFNRYLNQERTLAWFALDDDALGPIEDPTEEELRAFFEENREEFRAPELRDVSVVTLSAEALADPAAVSEEDVRQVYETDPAYGGQERRRVQQIVLDDPAVAERAAEALNDGAAFEAILTELELKFADVDLGLVTRSGLVDPAVREAAFAMEEPGAAAVEGRFGPVLVRVSAIEDDAKPAFEDVAQQIRQELALEEAEAEVRGLYNDIEDAVAGGARVEEIAERFDLPLSEAKGVTRDGLTLAGEAVELPARAQALATAFAAAEGDDAVPVAADGATSWVQLDGITPAAERPFEAVEGPVLFAWTEAEKAQRLETLASEALAAIEAGASVEAAAAEIGASARTTEPFSQASRPDGLPAAAASAAFEGAEGHADAVEAEDGRHVVFKVTSVSEPAFFAEAADVRGISRTLDEGVVNALRTDFVNAWQSEVGATLNQPVINQIVGLDERRLR